MDMSVKLNLSYPAAPAPQSAPAPVTADPQTPKVDAAAAAVKPKQEVKPDELEKAVKDIREFVQAAQRKLDFSIDDSTHQVVVKVIATESGEVIRQIPSETALKLAQSLHDASSLLFDAKV
ncbi:flagellar protein FlaG [Pseudomonas sp. K2I15]|uniref:flagellar protein FlaG n=1 Tax=unclassified Pseudomonas TaxID=196821 RepID=UPI000B4CEFC0|nr:flagellar protein FlaG [Pseudomonas sp. K2I15]OWP68879.1 flagellar biosynthesis protein FlaG [Pseudomonas sp. K2I15]